MEACASSHHWSRELQALGHTVRLMPPAYVKPYVKRHKNDATDAEAICEAVTRPNMRFVATKAPAQQSCLTLHRTRHLFIRQRYQFPYMERRARRPDPPQLAQATVRAAVGAASGLLAELPLVAGGKSFGGRMTSQAQAKTPLQGVRGLVFLGFPLHPAGRPSQDRAEHLFDVQIPMLFLQGTRDTLASLDQLEPLCKKLGRRATLKLFADADHSFHAPALTGRKDAQVFGDVLDALSAWVDSVIIPLRKKS
jgi:predicted alpha/beta-hydrolase family hydrolase